MNYGYLDYYISNINECLDDEVAELEKHTSDIIVDHLSYRPNFDALMEKLKEGDTLYAYNIERFASGLRDLVTTLKELSNRKITFISLKDNLTVDQTEKGQAVLNALIVATKAINADPIYGHYM